MGAANEKFAFEDSGAISSQGQVCFAGRDTAPAGGDGSIELWAKPLHDRKIAALVLNNGDYVVTDIDLADLNITDAGVRDVWARQDLPSQGGTFTVELEPHGSALLIFTPKRAVESLSV